MVLATLSTVELSVDPALKYIQQLMILRLFAFEIRLLAYEWFINNEKMGLCKKACSDE